MSGILGWTQTTWRRPEWVRHGWKNSNESSAFPYGLYLLWPSKLDSNGVLRSSVGPAPEFSSVPVLSVDGVEPGTGPLFYTKSVSGGAIALNTVAISASADIVGDVQVFGPLYVCSDGVKLIVGDDSSLFESSWEEGDAVTLFAEFNGWFMRAGRLEEMETPSPVVTIGSIWVDDSLVKYRQGGEDGTEGPNVLEISCGRNDYESFQILIHANQGAIPDVDVSISTFSNGSISTLPAPTIYKQHYVDCTENVSRVEFERGMYPDALVPKVDPYYGEERNVFPITVESGNVQGIWVDVGTMTGTTPGLYEAKATITSRGLTIGEVTIRLRVLDFEIPSTATFHASALWDGGRMAAAFGFGSSWLANTYFKDLSKQFVALGLRHRMSLRASNTTSTTNGMVWDAEAGTLTATTWEPFISWEAPGFSGELIPEGKTYAGAKKNVIMPFKSWPGESSSFPIPDEDRATVTHQFLDDFWQYLDANGYDPASNLFIPSRYDEPSCSTLVTLRGESVTACEAITTLAEDTNFLNGGEFRRNYVNASRKTGLVDFQDHGFYSRWIQKTTCPEWDRTCEYNTSQPKSSDIPGRDYWLYLGCASTGCGQIGNETYSDQVDVCADAIAMYNRLPGFLMYAYEATGTPFWSVNTGSTDPWLTLWRVAFDGYNHGDGFLIYPGIADGTGRTLGAHTPILGGTHDIPIESLRLKHWRDFLEDIEICRIAEAKHGREAVMAIVMRLFTTDVLQFAYWNLNLSVDNFRAVRNDLLALAEEA